MLYWARVRNRPLRPLGSSDPTGVHVRVREQTKERFTSQARVLVVEDTPVNQIVAEALLCELGVTVQIVRDGDQALSLLQTERFELVLMDCQLPTLSGFEATRRLRASLGPNHRTPVIALTGSAVDGMKPRVAKPAWTTISRSPSALGVDRQTAALAASLILFAGRPTHSELRSRIAP